MVETIVTASFGVSLSAKKNPKVALISGVTGQDGSYLAELLLSKNYEIHGIVRRSATPNTKNIDHILNKLFLHYGDLGDSCFIDSLIYELQPNECYNLACQSDVAVGFELPVYTADIAALGPLRFLEAIRKYSHYTKFYQASTSETMGNAPAPQDETTVRHPDNPYGISKLFAEEMVRLYRKSYGLFACSGILWNHESPRRGDNFVTQKIIKGLINCKLGKQSKLYLGNLDAKRDWGFAGDYVEAMWMMLQQSEPDDYAIGTGEAHSIREFLDLVSKHVKIDWRDVVEIDSNLYRPTETNYLLANSRKAQEKLGWKSKTSLEELITMMVNSELSKGGN